MRRRYKNPEKVVWIGLAAIGGFLLFQWWKDRKASRPSSDQMLQAFLTAQAQQQAQGASGAQMPDQGAQDADYADAGADTGGGSGGGGGGGGFQAAPPLQPGGGTTKPTNGKMPPIMTAQILPFTKPRGGGAKA